MNIRVFWDLSGGYWGFDTIPGRPLTKNDHLDFNQEDYQKLHELLLDEQSILKRRHKDDLFDKEEKRVSQVVDAVTGATSKEVKEAVVDGAVGQHNELGALADGRQQVELADGEGDVHRLGVVAEGAGHAAAG